MLMRQRRFTANAAHELRTPLAVLRVCIDNLTTGGTRQELAAETDRLSRRVNQLLALAKLEEGKIFFTDIDLGQLAADVTTYLVPLALREHRTLVYRPPGRPVLIMGDRFALEDALRNMIDNALRYTPVGMSVEIAVSQDGTVKIRDHGPGVPAAAKEQIFEPFWRADTQLGDGAGLGLSIVKHTALLHRGIVEVENHIDGGAVFSLKLTPLSDRLL